MGAGDNMGRGVISHISSNMQLINLHLLTIEFYPFYHFERTNKAIIKPAVDKMQHILTSKFVQEVTFHLRSEQRFAG